MNAFSIQIDVAALARESARTPKASGWRAVVIWPRDKSEI
jgi:hypothetical protein